MSKPLSSRRNENPACCLIPFFAIFGIAGTLAAIGSGSPVPLLFTALGVGGITWQVVAQRAQKNNLARRQNNWRPQSSDAAPIGENLILQPSATRLGGCIGTAIVAAIWNGFIGFFAWGVFFHDKSGGRIFMALFLIPFVLIGLLILFAAVGSFLKLFNANVQLTLNRAGLAPGDDGELSWQMRRGWFAPQNLILTLEGREEATYRRGTDTITEKSFFHRSEVVRTSSAAEMQSGTARLAIPAGAMHSFQAANNKIIWTLKLRGAVTLWPDIEDEYPLLVMPQKVDTGAKP